MSPRNHNIMVNDWVDHQRFPSQPFQTIPSHHFQLLIRHHRLQQGQDVVERPHEGVVVLHHAHEARLNQLQSCLCQEWGDSKGCDTLW